MKKAWKQENIVISTAERALICDFGCSRMLVAIRTVAAITETVKWNPSFWAPEFLDDKPTKPSKEADLWAFGVTVYVCIAVIITTRWHP